jgi:hypothetical protein
MRPRHDVHCNVAQEEKKSPVTKRCVILTEVEFVFIIKKRNDVQCSAILFWSMVQ